MWSNGCDVRLTRERFPVRSWALIFVSKVFCKPNARRSQEKGPSRGLNPGPPAPKAGIIPLDHTAERRTVFELVCETEWTCHIWKFGLAPAIPQTTPMGFEPTRAEPNGLAGRRLNLSATVSSTGGNPNSIVRDDCQRLSGNSACLNFGRMHHPGIEPGSHRWQRCILPLDQ